MDSRAHIYYSGSVQGVGFRISAERFAASLGLNGWVKNLRDGRVEIVCEGNREALDTFIGKIGSVFDPYITAADIERGKATGEFEGFDIRFE